MIEDTRNRQNPQDEASYYSMLLQWDPFDHIYVVTVPELPGCMTHGRTMVEAVDRGREAIEGWIAFQRARGRVIPPPRTYLIAEDAANEEEKSPTDRVAVS